jgi:hypothetical protein
MEQRDSRLTYLAITALTAVLAVSAPARAAGPATPAPRAGSSVATAPSPDGARIVRAASRERYGRHVEIDFQASRAADGSVRLDGASGDLTFKQVVRPGRGFVIEIATGNDRIALDVSPDGTVVTRNRKARKLAPSGATDADLDEVATLLGGSRAVRRFRAVAAAVQQSGDASGFSSAVLIADALVGEATGDTGASRRVADHLTRRIRARLKKVTLEGASCYDAWEATVLEAADDLEECANSFSWWSPWKYVCSVPWYLEVLSAWAELLSCSAGA